MVKKQHLKKVVGKAKWRINNRSDQYRSPLPVEEIISRAEAYMDKEVKYYSFGRNCEDFVKKLRYGEGVSDQKTFVGGESCITDTRDDKDDPKPGDLIEIKRGHYDHWALYVGDGYVIHVTPVDDGVPSLSVGNETILIIKVTKEFLKEVAGNDAWAVNNKYDQYCTPLPTEEIIQCAEGCIGKEMAYDVFDFKADDLVTKLRYGGQVSLGGELHFLDTGDDKDYLKPGDLIEIDRPLYQHWALYVGNGYVIHVTPVGKNSPPMSAGSVTLLIKRAKVKKELLKKAAGKDNWRVNNKYDPYRKPFPVEEIIRRAESQIGKVVQYRLFYKNCEHFVTEVRYGEGVSEQHRAFVGGKLHILDKRNDEEYPKPGDLIEIKRRHYDHWALYVGDGYVIHVTPADEGVPPLSADSDTILNIKVTKELLKEVIESDAWAVNNKYDQYCTPLPVEEIIQCAEGSIGKEMAYDVFDFKADDFVTKLRYGVQHRAFFGGESHILDMRDDEEYPKPGDLIEIKRGHYDHWALYVGDGYVIHVAPVDDGVACLSAGSGTILIIKVTKELLKEVAGKDAWAVNNKYDQYCTPLPVDEIIWRAEGCIGEEMAYDVFDFKADEFVTKLRYGGQLRAFVGGESHILDTGDDKEYPIPGDLIEIDRPLYQHWALYVGNGNVIHVTPVGENSPPASGSTMTLLVKRAKVKKELLEDAAGGDNWRVNNKYDEYREPFPVEEILRRAESQIGKVVLYRLFYKNCEHFVTEVRYGEGVSEQAMTALGKIRSTIGTVMVGVGTACASVLTGLLFPPALPVVAANGLTAFSTMLARNDFILQEIMKAKIHIEQKRCC
uniref:LRAT domain-containing protein n=1 Tax=Ficedula albicollis TaxID=59894 RepID=A0A803V997_FICAL